MKGKKIISLLLAGSMAVASAVCLLPDQARDVLASDSVVCDGNSADWGSIASSGSADGSVSDWKTCVSGSYLYLYAAQNPTGAYGEAIGNTKVSLTYNDSQLYNANYSTNLYKTGQTAVDLMLSRMAGTTIYPGRSWSLRAAIQITM